MADIDVGQFAEALNDKTDRDLRNVDTTAKADAVIDYQMPTAENNYTWYRKYKSGWVEQGGYIPRATSTGRKTITFPIEMAEPPKICSQMMYNIPNSDTGNVTWQSANFTNITTTSLDIMCHTTIDKSWQVSGMAAN